MKIIFWVFNRLIKDYWEEILLKSLKFYIYTKCKKWLEKLQMAKLQNDFDITSFKKLLISFQNLFKLSTFYPNVKN